MASILSCLYELGVCATASKEVIKKFKIDNFIINHKYEHSTKPVFDLLRAATAIPTWIDFSQTGKFNEGTVRVCIKNPDNSTNDKAVAPDINDSSIGLCLRYGGNLVYLTGDAGYPVINSKFAYGFHSAYDNFLKVSHHGSITGTNQTVLNNLEPTHNFISAGTSKRYNHPDVAVVAMIRNHRRRPTLSISKHIGRTVRYEITGTNIVES